MPILKRTIWALLFSIGIVGSSFLLNSCEEEDGTKIRYKEEFRYINETDSDIIIISYFTRELSTETQLSTHKITKGDTLVEFQITPDIDEHLIVNADSLKLIFPAEEEGVVEVVEINSGPDTNSCNLLDRNNYEYKKVSDHHFYSYSFIGAVCK